MIRDYFSQTAFYIRGMLVILLMCILTNVYSQTIHNQYVANKLSGKYTSIYATTGAAYISSLPKGSDDGMATNVPIGFNFSYLGTNYGTLSVSANGYVSFANTTTDMAENDLSSSQIAGMPILAVLWDNLAVGDSILYQTTGAAGKRVFTLEWKNMIWPAGGANPGVSFQLKLYESNSRIEYHYSKLDDVTDARSASIGISNTVGGPDNFLSITKTGAMLGFSTINASNNLNQSPATGQIYAFDIPSLYTDSLALVALYNATLGSGWTNKTNWLTSSVKNWRGIELDGQSRIQTINLEGNLLKGNLPAEIGNLSEMLYLNLSYNQIAGELTSELAYATKLVDLNLLVNQFTGTIPIQFTKLSKLTSLQLAVNKFSGELDPEILSNYQNITYLDLSYNQFTGNFPSSVGKMTFLTDLVISNNKFTGTFPIEIINCRTLQGLSLDNNLFGGKFPSEIGNMVSIMYVQLDNNNFTEIPSFMSTNMGINGYLSLFTQKNYLTFASLEVNKNLFGDVSSYSPQKTIPLQTNFFRLNIGTNNSINIEYLAGAALGGSNNRYQWFKDGAAIGGKNTIPVLTISNAQESDQGQYHCQITNTELTGLTLNTDIVNVTTTAWGNANIDSMALVFLYNYTNGDSWTNKTNWKTGPLNTWYGITMKNNRVTEIKLGNNNLSGTLPINIMDLTALTKFEADSNNISGNIPTTIKELKELYFLDLSYNSLSGAVPTELNELTSLGHLNLSHNQFTSIQSSSFTAWDNMYEINLSYNNLARQIITKFLAIPGLQILRLNNNQLDGVLPNTINNLSELEILDLSFNELSDSIPSSICDIITLTHLNFKNNNFTGNIPESIGNLINLTYFDLENNNLSGEIPNSLSFLSKLNYLNINNNSFTFLPDLSSTNLGLTGSKGLHCKFNFLTFNSLIPNKSMLDYADKYIPQQTIPSLVTDKVSFGYVKLEMSLNELIGRSVDYFGVKYQWVKDGIDYGETSNISTLTIDTTKVSDSGTYFCEMTSSELPTIALRTGSFNLHVLDNTAPLSVVLKDPVSISDKHAVISAIISSNIDNTLNLYYGKSSGSKEFQISKQISASDTIDIEFNNLLPNTTYYFSAEIVNSYGTVVSNEISFKTWLASINGVTSIFSTDITSDAALVKTNISTNTSTVVKLYYSKTIGGRDYVSESKTIDATSSIDFQLSGLDFGKDYYCFIEATNKYGVFVSLPHMFTTKCVLEPVRIISDDFSICRGLISAYYWVNSDNFSNVVWNVTNGEIKGGINDTLVTVDWMRYKDNYQISVSYSDQYGCSQTTSQPVLIKGTTNFSPVLKAKKARNYILIAFYNIGVKSYTWYHNGKIIPGANKQYYIVPEDKRYGEYLVSILLNDMCYNRTNALVFNKMGELDDYDIDYETEDYKAYPNPATSQVNVEVANSLTGIIKVQMLDLGGRILSDYVFEKNEFVFVNQIPLDKMSAGIYFLKIQLGNESPVIKRLIIE